MYYDRNTFVIHATCDYLRKAHATYIAFLEGIYIAITRHNFSFLTFRFNHYNKLLTTTHPPTAPTTIANNNPLPSQVSPK